MLNLCMIGLFHLETRQSSSNRNTSSWQKTTRKTNVYVQHVYLLSVIFWLILLDDTLIMLSGQCSLNETERVQTLNPRDKSRYVRIFSKIENLRFLQNYDDYSCIFGNNLSLSFIKGHATKLKCVHHKIF